MLGKLLGSKAGVLKKGRTPRVAPRRHWGRPTRRRQGPSHLAPILQQQYPAMMMQPWWSGGGQLRVERQIVSCSDLAGFGRRRSASPDLSPELIQRAGLQKIRVGGRDGSALVAAGVVAAYGHCGISIWTPGWRHRAWRAAGVPRRWQGLALTVGGVVHWGL
jgi:hypothetical protein